MFMFWYVNLGYSANFRFGNNKFIYLKLAIQNNSIVSLSKPETGDFATRQVHMYSTLCAGMNPKQLTSARISQRSNLIILPLVLSHMLIGMFSEYEQNLPLYGTFSVLNGITGGFVLFFHCTGNAQVRNVIYCFLFPYLVNIIY